jgi:hypothetical protein
MARPLRTLLASLKQLRGSSRARPREVQEHADLHRLYLYARLREEDREQRLRGGVGVGVGNGSSALALADRIVAEAAELSDDERREAVARALRRQAVAMARAVHEALERDAGDRAAAAAALRTWFDGRSGRRRRRGPMARPGDGEEGDESDGDGDDGDEAASSSHPASPNNPTTSAADLARLAARRVGFGLRVGPSAIGRGAGLGLFVQAAAEAPSSSSSSSSASSSSPPRAAVAAPAGALLAFFPGICYTKADYRRMAGYPKVDRGNPYLAARYDGIVVDSQPWARGDGVVVGVGVVGGEGEEAAAAATTTTTNQPPSYRDQADPFRPPRRPIPRSFLARMAKASDGPKLPAAAAAALREAAAARASRLRWLSATTDEASALELALPLEARNPYALAHFANHPAPGELPNAMIAPLDFEPEGVGGDGDDNGCALPVDLRAYLPFAPYEAAAALTVWPVERAAAVKGEEAAVEVARRRRWGVGAFAACEELALRPARGLGLVALRPLADGEEVVFDYRLSPGMLGRPSWYVPCDEQAEDRRWA